MKIEVKLDEMLVRRKMRSKELAEKVGITQANLSLIKNGHVLGIRFATLASLCHVLDCQPGDLLQFHRDSDPDQQDEPT